MSASGAIHVRCDYCGKPAELVDDTQVYQQSYGGRVWLCRPCGAWVGCHKNSKRAIPLGRLANAELRKAKIEAHAAFDPLWQAVARRDGINPCLARNRGYAWLAKEMGMEMVVCHIGKFNAEQCRRVVDLCRVIARPSGAGWQPGDSE